VEGAVRTIPWVCAFGWGVGRECGEYSFSKLPWRGERDSLVPYHAGSPITNNFLQTVMVLKYLIQNYPLQTLYFGIANIVANGLVMLRYGLRLCHHVDCLLTSLFHSTIVLWISQNIEDDYTYNLAL
jgi:hypothetical protein